MLEVLLGKFIFVLFDLLLCIENDHLNPIRANEEAGGSSTDTESRSNGISTAAVNNNSASSDNGGARPRTRSNDIEAVAIPAASAAAQTPSRVPTDSAPATPSRVANGVAPPTPLPPTETPPSAAAVPEEPLPPG